MYFNKRLVVLLSVLVVVIIAALGASVYIGAQQAQAPTMETALQPEATTTQISLNPDKAKFVGTWLGDGTDDEGNTLAFRADGTYKWTVKGITQVFTTYWAKDARATTTGRWSLVTPEEAGSSKANQEYFHEQYYVREDFTLNPWFVAADFSENGARLDLYGDGAEHTTYKKVNAKETSATTADDPTPHAVFPFVGDDSPAKMYQDSLYGFSFLYPSSWEQMNQTELESLASPQHIVKEFSIQSPDKQNIVRFIVVVLSDLMATDPAGECVYYTYNPSTETWSGHSIQDSGRCTGNEIISTTTITSNAVVGTDVKALSSPSDIDPKFYFIPINTKYGLQVELINRSSTAPNISPNSQIILNSLELSQ